MGTVTIHPYSLHRWWGMVSKTTTTTTCWSYGIVYSSHSHEWAILLVESPLVSFDSMFLHACHRRFAIRYHNPWKFLRLVQYPVMPPLLKSIPCTCTLLPSRWYVDQSRTIIFDDSDVYSIAISHSVPWNDWSMWSWNRMGRIPWSIPDDQSNNWQSIVVIVRYPKTVWVSPCRDRWSRDTCWKWIDPPRVSMGWGRPLIHSVSDVWQRHHVQYGVSWMVRDRYDPYRVHIFVKRTRIDVLRDRNRLGHHRRRGPNANREDWGVVWMIYDGPWSVRRPLS